MNNIKIIQYLFPYLKSDNYILQKSDISEILDLINKLKIKIHAFPIHILFAISTYLVLNRIYLNFTEKPKKIIPLRLITNIYGINNETFRKWYLHFLEIIKIN